jgi:glycosyltransferase involved in cell wall biosynthesis
VNRGNILVVTEWGFEEGLIQSYTLPYLKIIHKVNPSLRIYMVTKEKKGFEKDRDKLEEARSALKGYNIVLLPEKYYRAGVAKYILSVLHFLKYVYIIYSKRIQYIHSFCTPAGGYGYILSRLTGKKLIVDSYEPHAEYMVECGVWNNQQFAFRVLNWLEKRQAQRATYLIATTPNMVAHTQERFGIAIRNWDVKPACVDLDRFVYDWEKSEDLRNKLGIANKIVCVYAGKFGDFYLKEEVFEFYRVAFSYWKERFHVLLLSDLSPEELVRYCNQFELERKDFTLVNSLHEMVSLYLSAADFGISPYRPSPSKKFCTPIKNGEYWAVGLPIVITKDISVDSELIEGKRIGYVLKELTGEEYMNAVKEIDELLKGDRDELRARIRQIAIDKRSYGIAENIYKKIYC